MTAADPRVLELANARWRVGLLPGTGACIAYGHVARAGGGWAELLRPTPVEGYGAPEACASFPMLPWANRIGEGVLRFRGGEHRLARNGADGSAIHGVGRDHPWRVVSAGPEHAELELDSREVGAPGFPWPYTARIVYRLEGAALVVETTLGNAGESAFPAGMGHHPYFQRRLIADDPADEAQLEAPAALGYAMHRSLPSGAATPIEPRVDFRALRPLGPAPINDLLTGRAAETVPIRIAYPASGAELLLHAEDDYRHLVLYAPEGRDFFAVEPQSSANDGVTLAEAGVPGHGVFVLEPGQSRSLRWSLTVASPPA